MKNFLSIILGLLVLLIPSSITIHAQTDVIEIPTVSTLTGLTDKVHSVAFSNDDQFIITGDDAGKLAVWKASTGTLVTQWKATEATGGILKVQYSPDAKKIVSTDGQATIKLWDATTGKLLETFNAYTYQAGENPGAINDVVFNQDGTILYSANDNRYSVTLWNVSTGKRIEEFSLTSNPLALAYNPKDNQLAVGLADGSVNIRHAQTAAYIKAIPSWISDGGRGVKKLSYSPDYAYLYGSNQASSRPYILDVKKDYQKIILVEELYQLKIGDRLWLDFSFSPYNPYIAVTNPNVADNKGTLTIFDTNTKQIVASASVGSSSDTVMFSHDNKRVIAGKTIFDTSILPNQKYKEFTKKLNVAADKPWIVKFNLPVDPLTIKEKNIYITDEMGTKVSLVYYIEQGSVQLSPAKDYLSGKTYTLWVKDVKSKTGITLKQNTKMEFEIK